MLFLYSKEIEATNWTKKCNVYIKNDIKGILLFNRKYLSEENCAIMNSTQLKLARKTMCILSINIFA